MYQACLGGGHACWCGEHEALPSALSPLSPALNPLSPSPLRPLSPALSPPQARSPCGLESLLPLPATMLCRVPALREEPERE